MKRSIIFIILFIIIIFCFFGISNLLEYGDYEVNSYAADVTLENDGSMHVTEEWVVSYPEGYTVSYRDISYKKYNPNDTVLAYNNKTELFPSNIIASLFKFKPAQFFEVRDEAQREAPKVSF